MSGMCLNQTDLGRGAVTQDWPELVTRRAGWWEHGVSLSSLFRIYLTFSIKKKSSAFPWLPSI